MGLLGFWEEKDQIFKIFSINPIRAKPWSPSVKIVENPFRKFCGNTFVNLAEICMKIFAEIRLDNLQKFCRIFLQISI